ncbi:MAG: restriction endonuclease subunit S [Pseudomonadota bacterium]|nr:restriction endonuclease subunit S [Pseudomonadota bacterium]
MANIQHLTLPWVEVEIGDIAEVKGGKRLPKGKSLLDTQTAYPYIRVTDFKMASVDLSSLKYLDDETQRAIKNYTISKDDLYISIAGTIGIVGQIPPELDGANLTENAAKLCSLTGVDQSYLRYVISSNAVKEQFNESMTSSGQPKLALFRIKNCQFLLPPLAEQKVIADKLATLLAQVETTKARLERIPEILKTFRQSVLAAAVSGKLNAGDYQQAPVYKALGDVGVEVKTGPFGSALHKSEYISGGIPVINPMHISNGTIVASQQMTIPKAKYDELEAWHLKIGDVVVGRRGEMGRAAVVNYKGEMLCGTGSMILRTPKNSLPKYLEIILRSPLAVEYFTSNSVGSTMVNLNQKIIKSLQVHFPSQEEQTEIVRRVEKLFAYADKVEAQVKTAQARVNQLTQSILAKAFRGELTANWRAANPELISGENSAEALLVIIKNERAKLSQTKKGRGKSVEN